MGRVFITDYREDEQSASQIGGKALHLFRLERWGQQVPPFAVLSAAAFAKWRENGEKLSDEMVEQVTSHVGTWGAKYFAVRSSMSAEDGAEASYAGMMDTFLFVPQSDLRAAIQGCFESANSQRAKMYHEKHSQAKTHESAAVIIQVMVPSEVSGVAFSRAPVGDSSLVYIEAGLGLGEGVVSGTVEVDRFYLDRWESVVETHVGEKRVKVAHNEEAKSSPFTHEVQVSPEEGDKVSLNADQLVEIAAAVLKIEGEMAQPADVEWAVVGDQLYILQARPITTALPKLEYFIDTNLSESYPGLISPMGGSFVSRVYEMVHFRCCEILGFSDSRQKGNLEAYHTLVQNVGGHLYYNLKSYYRMMLSLPGGQASLDNWHRMIGGSRNDYVVVDDVPEHGLLETARYYAAILRLIVFHERIFDSFGSNGQARLEEMVRRFLEEPDPAALILLIEREINASDDFGLTSLNDLLIMLSTKKLVDLLAKHGYSESVLPDLIRTEEGVESVKPLIELNRLCASFKNPDALMATYRTSMEGVDEASEQPYANVYAALDDAGFGEDRAAINEYLRVYGHRSFEELKLESLSFSQSPKEFHDVLMWKLNSSPSSGRDLSDRQDQAPVDIRLPGLANRWFGMLVRLAQRTIATREETRFLRGAYYGGVRTGLLAVLRRLRQAHPGEFQDIDVSAFFGLTRDELIRFANGEWSAAELAQRARDNANWVSGPTVFPEYYCQPVDAETTPWFMNNDVDTVDAFDVEDGVLGTGLGASPGVIEGIPLAISNPRDALGIKDLGQYILVTKNTDPAWVFIMAQCAGLISEKGSLLSHTAIIGRELSIPTIVGVKNAVARLGGFSKIRIDGNAGMIQTVEAAD